MAQGIIEHAKHKTKSIKYRSLQQIAVCKTKHNLRMDHYVIKHVFIRANISREPHLQG